MTPDAATEATKNALENAVAWYLQEKLAASGVTVATQKFLTGDNRLIYLTRLNVAEMNMPRVKIQVFERVNGGVNETGYQLYGDHRLEKYHHAMIFGTTPSGPEITNETVSETEAAELNVLVAALQANARALV